MTPPTATFNPKDIHNTEVTYCVYLGSSESWHFPRNVLPIRDEVFFHPRPQRADVRLEVLHRPRNGGCAASSAARTDTRSPGLWNRFLLPGVNVLARMMLSGCYALSRLRSRRYSWRHYDPSVGRQTSAQGPGFCRFYGAGCRMAWCVLQ